MVSKTVKIVNRMGLHARPASLFVMEAKKFESSISIHKEGLKREVSAKSIMMVLAGGFSAGDIITISCDGPDEQEALDAMERIVESGLGDEMA